MSEDKQRSATSEKTIGDETQIADEIYELAFGIRCSINYHKKRADFFKRLDRLSLIVSSVSGGIACALFLSDYPWLAKLLTFIAAFVNITDLVTGFSRKNIHHISMQQRFSDLLAEIQIGKEDEKNFCEWEAERTKIEKDDSDNTLRALAFLCHNEEAFAQNNGVIYDIPGKQLKFRYLLSWEGWTPNSKCVLPCA